MSKILDTIKKYWTRVWLIGVLLLSCGVYIAHAAYTGLYSVKRVVSTQNSVGELFSSNCMRTDEASKRRLTSAEYTVTVCNFDQNKPTTYNPSVINYTLHAKLQIKVGSDYKDLADLKSDADYSEYVKKAEKYTICKTDDDENGAADPVNERAFTEENSFSVEFDQDALEANKSSIDKYRVKIDEEDLNDTDSKFFVYVWAEPDQNFQTIGAKLYGAKIDDTASWTGEFLENDCDTVDYDFYNYVVSGSGKGYVDILWDPTKFEINKFFYEIDLEGKITAEDIS